MKKKIQIRILTKEDRSLDSKFWTRNCRIFQRRRGGGRRQERTTTAAIWKTKPRSRPTPDKEEGSRIRSVKIIKRQKEQTFPSAVSTKVPRTFPCTREPSADYPLFFPCTQPTPGPGGNSVKEYVWGNTSAPLRVCVTFKPLAVQVDFYLNEVSTGIDQGLFLYSVHRATRTFLPLFSWREREREKGSPRTFLRAG